MIVENFVMLIQESHKIQRKSKIGLAANPWFQTDINFLPIAHLPREATSNNLNQAITTFQIIEEFGTILFSLLESTENIFFDSAWTGSDFNDIQPYNNFYFKFDRTKLR